jgi:hypothetical protein
MSSVDVAAVVDDQLGPWPPGMRDRLERELPVLLERLALPGEHRRAGRGDRGGGVVLGREDVAARPSARRAPSSYERLDQHGGLDRHVQRAGDAHALERLAAGRTSSRTAIRPGISCSAMVISLRPQSARREVLDVVIARRVVVGQRGGCGHEVADLAWMDYVSCSA